MRHSGYLIAAAGLVLGAGLIALLPQGALFAVADLHDHSAESATGERWACPMMDFISNHPGNCPVQLELQSAQWVVSLKGEGLYVTPSDLLMTQLERLFGRKVAELV